MNAKTINLTALLAIIAGILIQVLGGNENIPTIPPGIVLAAVAMIAVLLARPWWIIHLGWAIPTMLLVGGFIADPGLLDVLRDPENETIRAGAAITGTAYLVAIGSGAGAAMVSQRQQSTTKKDSA